MVLPKPLLPGKLSISARSFISQWKRKVVASLTMDHVTTKHEVEPRASEKTWTTSPRENPHTTTRPGGIFNSTRRAARIQQARPLHPLQPRVACAGFQKMHTSHPSTFSPATKWRLVSCQSDPGASSCSLEFKQFTTRREAMDHFSKLKAEAQLCGSLSIRRSRTSVDSNQHL